MMQIDKPFAPSRFRPVSKPTTNIIKPFETPVITTPVQIIDPIIKIPDVPKSSIKEIILPKNDTDMAPILIASGLVILCFVILSK